MKPAAHSSKPLCETNLISSATLGVLPSFSSSRLTVSVSLIEIHTALRGGDMATAEAVAPAKRGRLVQARYHSNSEGGIFLLENGRFGPTYPRTTSLLPLYHLCQNKAWKRTRPSSLLYNTIEKTIADPPLRLKCSARAMSFWMN